MSDRGEAQQEPTTFLNVDLDVVSRTRLDPLVAAFGRKVFVLHVSTQGPPYEAHLELEGSHWPKTEPDAIITKFVALIAALPARARRFWDGARSREFNIGIQAGVVPRVHELRLKPRTLEAVAAVGATVVITTYAPDTSSSATKRRTAPRGAAQR
jgi:hypothetical protein